MSVESLSSVAGSERRVWALSISNLVGICLCVGVLLFSTSVIDRESWRSFSESLSSAFGPETVSLPLDIPSLAFLNEDVGVEDLRGVVRRRLDLLEMSSRTAVTPDGDLKVVLRGFHPGDGSAEEVRTLTALAEVFRQVDRDVSIGSHGVAPPRDQNQSVHIWRLLWEANLIRAVETVEGLSSAGYDRYTPIETTLSEGEKGAQIEVVVRAPTD